MYTQHFRLTELPFSIAPNPRYLYLSAQHREALAHLLYGIGVGGGFVVLTGEVGTGKTTLCRALLDHGISIEHACELSCACTTCHVIVRQGGDSLDPSEDQEDDMLDKAWGLTSQSRLSCQVVVRDEDLVVEIPKYTINYAREDH